MPSKRRANVPPTSGGYFSAEPTAPTDSNNFRLAKVSIREWSRSSAHSHYGLYPTIFGRHLSSEARLGQSST